MFGMSQLERIAGIQNKKHEGFKGIVVWSSWAKLISSSVWWKTKQANIKQTKTHKNGYSTFFCAMSQTNHKYELGKNRVKKYNEKITNIDFSFFLKMYISQNEMLVL